MWKWRFILVNIIHTDHSEFSAHGVCLQELCLYFFARGKSTNLTAEDERVLISFKNYKAELM